MKILGLIAVVITGILLLYASGDFPAWGDAQSPANSKAQVSERYLEDAYARTKTPNIVTAVLADYRSFDTMFETVVIFVAGIAIIAILSALGKPNQPRGGGVEEVPEQQDLIIVQTCKLVIPIIQLFALYVVAHGHYSPGGGFQGGVMFGASFILWALACGLPAALKQLSERRSLVLSAFGIIIFAGWGFFCLLMGGNFLDYGFSDGVLPEGVKKAHSHSMLIVEIGVAFTVTSIMFVIYANLSSRGRLRGGL